MVENDSQPDEITWSRDIGRSLFGDLARFVVAMAIKGRGEARCDERRLRTPFSLKINPEAG